MGMLQDIAVVILAAGLGKRMASPKAKVLHEIVGKPMVEYVIEAAQEVTGGSIVLVVGHQADLVKDALKCYPGLKFALQAEQLGTGHAVSCALPHLSRTEKHVLILCGDVPLVRPHTLAAFLDSHIRKDREVSLLATEVEDPHGYGRVLTNDDHKLIAVVEEADASDAQRRINLINTGIYCVERHFLASALQKIDSENAQGEYYLTDIIAIAHGENRRIGAFSDKNADQFKGVNSPSDLAQIETKLQR
jgi:bifunctional UDP-N-acetylglucosamine pyrophosphorylase/glucosamine-1-phosphate N-acetyltransferase/UDP-N-acetylglucosamine pyrophosphorylase